MITLVKRKEENWQALLKYDKLLVAHFFSEDFTIAKLASKIIGEVLEHSHTLQSLEEDPLEEEAYQDFTSVKKSKVARSSTLLSCIPEWIEAIEPITHSHASSNIEKQTLLLKILAMICREANGNGIRENQCFILNEFRERNLFSLKFGVEDENAVVEFIPGS